MKLKSKQRNKMELKCSTMIIHAMKSTELRYMIFILSPSPASRPVRIVSSSSCRKATTSPSICAESSTNTSFNSRVPHTFIGNTFIPRICIYFMCQCYSREFITFYIVVITTARNIFLSTYIGNI